jgi:hypothetical protein
VIATRRARRKQVDDRVRTLCAIVRCGSASQQLAVAIPADTVTFIASSDEVRLAERDSTMHVSVADFTAPGLLLHELLGLDGAVTTWLFVRTSAGTIALGSGECLTVRKLVDPDPLPRGIFRSGGTAIIGAFQVEDAFVEGGCARVGIWVDPSRLLAVRPA